MSVSDKDKWDTIYQSRQQIRQQARQKDIKTKKIIPAYILQEFHHLLPAHGKALDLASGPGANALFLAQHNMESHAWDISSIAIEKLKETANTLNLEINTEVRDIVTKPPEENTFDVIVVSHFLDRQIMPAIITALRDDGLLFYQTFTISRVEESGPSSEKYRLGKNELLNMCKDLDVIVYQEEDTLGNIESGFRNEALLIGQRKRTI